MTLSRAMIAALADILDRGERAALATVVRASGSTPQALGARLLLRRDGSTVGTVGGGAIEATVTRALEQVLAGKPAHVVGRHLARDLGMCCGGTMDVLVEAVERAPTLLLFGAGHVAKPVASFAAEVGFDVVVIDAREELNDAARFPRAKRVLLDPLEALRGGELTLDGRVYAVITTHDHRLDEDLLEICRRAPLAYVGMIGSERKVRRVWERLDARSGTEGLDRVHAPIGLDLGGRSPEEIALAIVAELVLARRGGTGRPMRIFDGTSAPDVTGDPTRSDLRGAAEPGGASVDER